MNKKRTKNNKDEELSIFTIKIYSTYLLFLLLNAPFWTLHQNVF